MSRTMSWAPSPDIAYLLSLQAVRERSRIVFAAAREGRLHSFEYDEQRMSAVADYVISVIDRDFGPDRFTSIPPHGRWQHFDVGGVSRVNSLLDQWTKDDCDKMELTRRLVDLFFVSVLLDAGAGDTWKFVEPGSGQVYNRSEGIAVASLYMFKSGDFSQETGAQKVDAAGLLNLTDDIFSQGFQITPENPLIGVSSRVKLLNSVGGSLLRLSDIVGPTGRPGNLVDYLTNLSGEAKTIDYEVLWSTLQQILVPSWPADRTRVDGFPIGDAWPLKVLSSNAKDGREADTIQPFHKLTQWLGYSLTVPFVRVLDFQVINAQLGTGLPEYRNGGLFVDLGALKLKPELAKEHTPSDHDLPAFSASSDTVIEWRAMTVALLDELYKLISAHFAKLGVELSMAQMLEAGTWKGGRELAAKFRPHSKSSPIVILGDGTLF
ncbi:DUF1688-domain-containing protein [Hypoxylon rubiginosum]|uniref:DUF1688-domain-containing protein n=1 Tax=Hypoxylon rubiginosum TaxID=110542 RepID=A0ACB9Z6S3_9PEZI|nr:DUF1688-domain-containing protein [Hypoxylon rubiginosum]